MIIISTRLTMANLTQTVWTSVVLEQEVTKQQRQCLRVVVVFFFFKSKCYFIIQT